MFTSNDEHIGYTIRKIVSAISERQAGIRGETKKPKLLAQMTMVALEKLRYEAALTFLFLDLLILVLCNRMGQVQMPSEQSPQKVMLRRLPQGPARGPMSQNCRMLR